MTETSRSPIWQPATWERERLRHPCIGVLTRRRLCSRCSTMPSLSGLTKTSRVSKFGSMLMGNSDEQIQHPDIAVLCSFPLCLVRFSLYYQSIPFHQTTLLFSLLSYFFTNVRPAGSGPPCIRFFSSSVLFSPLSAHNRLTDSHRLLNRAWLSSSQIVRR